MANLILLGGGGHCESVIEAIQALPKFNIMGVLDPSYDQDVDKEVLGFPILGNDDEIDKYIAKGYQFVITVGQIKSSNTREKLCNEIISKGGKLPVIIAKTSFVSKKAKIAEGTVILHNAFVNAGASLGICCIVNTGAIIEHGCSIGNFVHISTGAILNGEVNCGNGVFIGSGTIINQGITVGDKTVIASGSLVRRPIEREIIVGGNPLKKIK